jgi:hypothetical protein
MIPRNSISSCLLCLYVCHSLCAAQTAAQAEVVRRDFFVPSDPYIQIFVREVRPHHLQKEGVSCCASTSSVAIGRRLV